ncbi:MAG TPA: NAD(P)/FAD-dependent oxidoreductase [Candidatus Limnocylindria bacterium]|nr:NAD(P)/FAD-dependent oxidoreductase [Candidatus Limnocylindria bacterium]
MASGEIHGKTVAIVGGGPGGCATAIKLLQLSRKLDLGLRVVLFEGKDFERHYNQCAGVLSPPIEELLQCRLDVELPYETFKRQIFGYRLYAGNRQILLVGQHRGGATYTVRRVFFDRFFLSCAEKAGAEVSHSRVTAIDFPQTGRDSVYLYTEGGMLKADVVVGAFGLDDGMMSIFETATKGQYRRPGKYMHTFVVKIASDRGFIEKKLGSIIYAYLFPPGIPNLDFGAITPKGDHIIVNVAGRRATVEDMFAFLSLDIVRDHLPALAPDSQEVYRGKFPGKPAHGTTGDRYLLVGDATGWMRPFKGKGINLAIHTGILAAETMVEFGISAASFRRYEERTRELREDYHYGTWMRHLCKVGEIAGTLGTVVSMAQLDQGVHDALFNAVSGHDSFRNIFRQYARPRVLAEVVRNYVADRRRRRS